MASSLYNPLDPAQHEIRVLIIEPAKSGDALETVTCALTTTSLLQLNDSYSAVSYVWGDPTDTELICLSGQDFRATRSLVAFLRWYRGNMLTSSPGNQGASTLLWVDALCINQQDIPERNSQVRMMGSIYRSAKRTYAWLGQAEDDSDYAIQQLWKISERILEHQMQLPSDADTLSDPLAWVQGDQTEWFQRSPDCSDDEKYGPTRNRFWWSAARLLSRPYWKRAWITQELTLSKTVILVCGTSLAGFPQIQLLAMWLRKVEGMPCPSLVDQTMWRFISTSFGKSLLGWGQALSLFWLVHLPRRLQADIDKGLWPLAWRQLVMVTLSHQATDPRDKLYSILGLLNYDVQPDYSLPLESVFCNFAKLCIQTDGCLDVTLRSAGYGLGTGDPDTITSFVPSWVPNWDLLSKEPELPYFQRKIPGQPADAEPSSNPVPPPWRFDGNTLLVRGFLSDRVAEATMIPHVSAWVPFYEAVISRHGDSYTTDIPMMQALARLYFIDRDILTNTPLGESPNPELMVRLALFAFVFFPFQQYRFDRPEQVWEKFGFTSVEAIYEKILGRRWSEVVSTDSLPQMLEWLQGLKPGRIAFQDQGLHDYDIFDLMVAPGFSESFLNHSMKLFVKNGVFVTDNGYLGWGPAGMQSGDLVCFLQGCEVPVVLRKVDSHYLHMGTCFVLGIEVGKNIRSTSEDSQKVQEFCIV